MKENSTYNSQSKNRVNINKNTNEVETNNEDLTTEDLYNQYIQLSYLNLIAEESYFSQIKQAEEQLYKKMKEKNSLLEKVYSAKIELNRMINLEIIETKLSLVLKSFSRCEKEINDFNKEVSNDYINNVNFSMSRLFLEDNLVNDQKIFWENLTNASQEINKLNTVLESNNEYIKDYLQSLNQLINELKIKKDKLNETSKEILNREDEILNDNLRIINNKLLLENKELFSNLTDCIDN